MAPFVLETALGLSDGAPSSGTASAGHVPTRRSAMRGAHDVGAVLASRLSSTRIPRPNVGKYCCMIKVGSVNANA